MSTISNMETALLGLLSEKPMYPYEIEKKVYELDMRYWTEISLSSIYKVLEKLEKKFFVDVNLELTGTNKVKKIYTITEKGKKELKEKITELLSELEISICQVDLALANLSTLTPAEVRDALLKYQISISKRIACYGELETYLLDNKCQVGNLALARRRTFILKGELEWAKSFLEEYNAMYPEEE